MSFVIKTVSKPRSEKGTVPFCSEDCAQSGQSPAVLKSLLSQFGRALAAASFLGACCQAAEPTGIEVRETAGIQRFGYPLAAEFRASATTKPLSFRLRDGQRDLAAQFTRLTGSAGAADAHWSVDFSINLLPGETRILTIDEFAESGAPTNTKHLGLRVERADRAIRILHPSLEFRLADDLQGLFEAIAVRGDDYLVADSPGLVLHLRDGLKLPCVAQGDESGGSATQIIKSGPLAAAIQFKCRHKLSESKAVYSTVDLDFPLGKSWVRVDWRFDDPDDAVAAMSGEIRLRLEPEKHPPILADVGAGGWTYAALGPEDRLIFRARGKPVHHDDSTEARWQVDRILAGRVVPFVRPPQVGTNVSPQGWGHLMDAKRATAIAMDRFAETTDDTLELAGQGRVYLQRAFAPRPTGERPVEKRLTFWLHVVSSPPQWGAATSPQSMLFPPRVRRDRSGRRIMIELDSFNCSGLTHLNSPCACART